MHLHFEIRDGYLVAIVRNRETMDEARANGATILEMAQTHQIFRIVVRVEASTPIFRVEQYGLSDWMDQVRTRCPQLRLALVSDSPELHASHQYLELLGAQRGVSLKAYRAEQPAIAWLLSDEAEMPHPKAAGARR